MYLKNKCVYLRICFSSKLKSAWKCFDLINSEFSGKKSFIIIMHLIIIISICYYSKALMLQLWNHETAAFTSCIEIYLYNYRILNIILTIFAH